MQAEKKTVLHDFHVKQNAMMASFGGYDMPLWYPTGVKTEHLAVIRNAGIFDTSHMAVVTVRGEGARELLQNCLSKDMDRCIGLKKNALSDGRCVYGIFLNPDGTVIDDAIIYQLQPDAFMVVVNAAMGGIIAEHLQKSSDREGITIEDLTDRVGKMDIQGPDSAKILGEIIRNSDQLFEGLTYFSFKGGFGSCTTSTAVELNGGTKILVSRTGYTGEFGFELFVEIDKLQSLWEGLLKAGEEYGLVACGLASRDSLRAGAVLPLSHQDIGPWPFLFNPWQFALAWSDDGKSFSKDFIGADALLEENDCDHTLPFAGFDPRKIAAGDDTYVINDAGEKIGAILTCTTDMAIGRVDGEIIGLASEGDVPEGFKPKGLSCGFLLLDKHFAPGELVYLTDGKRKLKVEIREDVRPGRTARKPIKMMLT
ncbi:MAG: aminomethyltransferase family protein [Deltaproteobacteria bacterium]|nr:aminomethyltransferase family protein [Deltaproteobacteria bacterium]